MLLFEKRCQQMGCFEGKCFQRPKNEIGRSGSLQKKGSRVRVLPAGDLVIGVHPNNERPSALENVNPLTEGAISKRGYNSAQKDCGCAKDYDLPEPFVDKIFPKEPPLPPTVFKPEPEEKKYPKDPPEEYIPIPEPELKDNPVPPPEVFKPNPVPPPEFKKPDPTFEEKEPGPTPEFKKPDPTFEEKEPGPTPEDQCTIYDGWLAQAEARICCDELENKYGGDYAQQQLHSELCRDPRVPATETKQPGPTIYQTDPGKDALNFPDNSVPPLSQMGPTTNNGGQGGVITVNNSKGKGNAKVVVEEMVDVGSGFETELVETNQGNAPQGFTFGTFQNGNVTPVTDPNANLNDGNDVDYTYGQAENEFENELIAGDEDFSVDVPSEPDSIDHFSGSYTAPGFETITETDLAQDGLASQPPPEGEEAVILGSSNTVIDKPIVAPSTGMNLGLDKVNGLPRCNNIVRSVTVSRCGDDNPFDRGLGMYDVYESRYADPPGFVVNVDDRKVFKVKNSSGLRNRVRPAGLGESIPGGSGAVAGAAAGASGTDSETNKQDNTGNRSSGPGAGAVTASVFNTLGSVAGDALQYMNNQDQNRIRVQIANLGQQRDLQLAAINSGDVRTRAMAEAQLAQINQQGVALTNSLRSQQMQLDSNAQIANRDLSFRQTALIAGSVLALGLIGAGVYVATKK